MGAWGIKTFDDDSACDWIYDLEESEGTDFLEQSLNPKEEGGYLDLEGDVAILCACELIHSILHGPRDGVPEDVVNWINNNRGIDVTSLKKICVDKINRLLSDKSELNELWAENEDEYDNWKNNVLELREALVSN